MNLKPGDRVIMNDKYHVSPANKGKVWKVVSEPWIVCGSEVVKLEGKSGGYAVDGLDLVIPMSDNEKLVLKHLYEALKQAVGIQCPVPLACPLCGVHDVCEKSGNLFREVEKKLKEWGEIT